MVVWLDEIYVKPEFRSQGIGSELIDFVIEKYKNKISRFRLEITESNIGAKKKLYLSKGFLRIYLIVRWKYCMIKNNRLCNFNINGHFYICFLYSDSSH